MPWKATRGRPRAPFLSSECSFSAGAASLFAKHLTEPSKAPTDKFHGEALENVDHFQCVLSTKAAIDEESQHGVRCASGTFSCLRKGVFENNSIRSDTKFM
eukprot:g29607.t1